MSTLFRFKELQLRNFMSFGNATVCIDLTPSESILVQGQNIDNAGANGAGKTSLINAICYALYNKPFDQISLQRLVNTTNDIKNTLMEVRLTFDKGVDEYEIYRCRGENFTIQILKNGEDITLDSVNENDRLVQEIIGISYDLFTKVIIFSGNSSAFLTMPVSQQRQQIEELFNITLLAEKAAKLKEIIKTTETNISIQQAVVKEQEAQLALYNKQVKDTQTRVEKWESDRAQNLQLLGQQLQLLNDINIEDEKELHSLVANLKTQQTSLAGEQTVLERDLSQLEAEISQMQGELEHLVEAKCPYCLQKYAGAKDKIADKRALVADLKNKVVEKNKALDRARAERQDIMEQQRSAQAVMHFNSLTDAIRAENNAHSAQQKILDLERAENPHVEVLDQLLTAAAKGANYTDLDALKRDLEHQQFLLKLLTDKNSFIRRKIINQTVPFLNARLAHYTRALGLPHITKFDDDMGCSISEYGRELDFGNLSSGEKKRVNLSLSLAFRDVLHHLHAKVNCLFIDEIDASLDASGVENVFKLLKSKSRDENLGLWIISHRPEAIGRFDRTVIVRKENGFSRIVNETDDDF